jgi:hypothetical protein
MSARLTGARRPRRVPPLHYGASAGDFNGIELAPLAQRTLRGFRFEIIPALEDISTDQQRSEVFVGATLAEHISNLIEVIGQKFARKIQDHALAEIELSFVGDRDIFLVVLDIIWQFFLNSVQIGSFGTPMYLSRLSAKERLMQAAAACNEFE